MTRKTKIFAAALALLLPMGGGALTQTDSQERRGRSADDRFLEIEARAPGFGGFFRDKDGALAVYLVDGRQRPYAEEAIADLLGADEVARSGGIRVLQGEYAFSELAAWRAQAGTVLSIPGVALTDVDESANRLRIGIEREDARGAVEQELDRLGIPREAVAIEVTGPFSYTVTLQDRYRPVVGGVQITFGCDSLNCFVCTDGFTVARSGVPGFVTCSHCTTTQGQLDGTSYYQPLPGSSSATRIGNEMRDPAYITGGSCPAGRQCRVSDSAFVKRKKKVLWSRGFIARPNSIGSLTLTSASQSFRITSEGPTPVVGDQLDKVGRTTGWTRGEVANTCVDVNVSDTTITLLCQDIVNATVAGGDSGSPVFKVTSGNDVALYGILWGGSVNGSQFVFSPLDGIESDLGPLRTCVGSAGC